MCSGTAACKLQWQPKGFSTISLDNFVDNRAQSPQVPCKAQLWLRLNKKQPLVLFIKINMLKIHLTEAE